MRALLTTALLALALVAGACGDGGTGSDAPDVAQAPLYDGAGKHPVVSQEVTLQSGREDTGPLAVWHPEPRDGAVGPYPLVVFGHGQALAPTDYSDLLEHVASWGFVVAAPEHIKDVDLVQVADDLRIEATSGAIGVGLLDEEGPLALIGHSAGTGVAGVAAAGDRAAEVVGTVMTAGGGAAAGAQPPSPILFLVGGRDAVADTWARSGFEAATGPAQMVTIEDGGHLSFSDLCREGDAPGLSPAECAPGPEIEAEVDLLTRHATVAFLRWRFGSDGTPVALDPAVLAAVSEAATSVEGSFAGVG